MGILFFLPEQDAIKTITVKNNAKILRDLFILLKIMLINFYSQTFNILAFFNPLPNPSPKREGLRIPNLFSSPVSPGRRGQGEKVSILYS
jgi:hypothetical protein